MNLDRYKPYLVNYLKTTRYQVLMNFHNHNVQNLGTYLHLKTDRKRNVCPVIAVKM